MFSGVQLMGVVLLYLALVWKVSKKRGKRGFH